MKSVEGVYRSGRIELASTPMDVPDETPVVVTFLESQTVEHQQRGISLQERGIAESQAGELRGQLAAFAEDWERPEMSVYDNYDEARSKMSSG